MSYLEPGADDPPGQLPGTYQSILIPLIVWIPSQNIQSARSMRCCVADIQPRQQYVSLCHAF